MPTTDRKKNQPTTDMVQHCRDICIQKYTVFFFVFLFPCLSKVFCLICFQRRGGLLVSFFRQELNHFNFQFRYLQNFLSLNQDANCVQSKSCKVRFSLLSRHVQKSAYLVSAPPSKLISDFLNSVPLFILLFEGNPGLPAQRVAIEPTRCQLLQYFHCVLFIHARNMSKIIKVMVSFFRKGQDVAIERHRSCVPLNTENYKGGSLRSCRFFVFVFFFFSFVGRIKVRDSAVGKLNLGRKRKR